MMSEFLFPTLTPFGFVFLGPSYMHTQRGSYTHPFFISFFILVCSFQEILRFASYPHRTSAHYVSISPVGLRFLRRVGTQQRNEFSTLRGFPQLLEL